MNEKYYSNTLEGICITAPNIEIKEGNVLYRENDNNFTLHIVKGNICKLRNFVIK